MDSRFGAIAILLSLSSPLAAATVVDPGQAFYYFGIPYSLAALEYDFGNSTLYTIMNSGSAYVFGSIDPQTGTFVSLNSNLAISQIEGTARTWIDYRNNDLLVESGDEQSNYLLTIHLSNGKTEINRNPPLTGLSGATGFDGQSRQEFGQAENAGIFNISIQNSNYLLLCGRGSVCAQGQSSGSWVTTVDSDKHIFYVEELVNGTPTLTSINELSGQILARTPLPETLYSLKYNPLTRLLIAIGITDDVTQVVSVDTNNGQLNVIAIIGDGAWAFFDTGRATVEDNQYFTVDSSANTLLTLDIAASRSWYVEILPDEYMSDLFAWMYGAGQTAGQHAAEVPSNEIVESILEFGQPDKRNGEYGASGYSQFISTANIEKAALQFAQGFVDGSKSTGAKLALVVGTQAHGKLVLKKHGAVWSAMIDQTNASLHQKGFDTLVTAYGGIDIELEPRWALPPAVSDWVSGYGRSDYVDFGNAKDCTFNGPNCAEGWQKSDVARLAGTNVIPEIYNTHGKNADQWSAVSLYQQQSTGQPLHFLSSISQSSACTQRKCKRTEKNTPAAAWLQLTQSLKKALGNKPALNSTTDIEHRTLN